MRYLPLFFLLTTSLTFGIVGQTQPTELEPAKVISGSGETVEDGMFRSTGGNFSISIPALPKQTIDNATEKAKAKGIDVGRQFVWIFERTLFTVYYNPPVDKDGNPSPQVYSDMQIGTRKGIFNSGATLTSEKPFTRGSISGTEFRYIISNGVKYVNRVFLVGDMGYQVVGGYAEDKYEKDILDTLNSFKPLKERALTRLGPSSAANDAARPGEMRLTRIDSITGTLASKHYFYLKEEGFRVLMPGNFSNYVPSKPAKSGVNAVDGQVSWDLPEANVVIMFSNMDDKLFSGFTPEQKKLILSRSLASMINTEGFSKISERDIVVSGIAGKEMKYQRGEIVYLARNLFLGSRMIVFVAQLHPFENAEALVEQVFDSFEPLKK